MQSAFDIPCHNLYLLRKGMPSNASKKILIVPLDWGLGHTTRCIPIIKELIALHHDVHIGGTEITNSLLRNEFPEIQFHSYPSFSITYPKKGKRFIQHMMMQIPKLAAEVKRERKITAKLVTDYQYDIIISDNRFGVRHPKCLNIFISHQLNLSVPQSAYLQLSANWCNHYFLNKFDRIGVPDLESKLLSGQLSLITGINKPIVHLGNLSRWKKHRDIDSSESILAILSGPEPQRTYLEEILKEQSAIIDIPVTIVRAKPNDTVLTQMKGVKTYNHLPADELQRLAEESGIIISRAGYSTIMDLVAIEKNAILIPTPGQTEQEYLAHHLADEGLFLFCSQEMFDLKTQVERYKNNVWKSFPNRSDNLREKLLELIS